MGQRQPMPDSVPATPDTHAAQGVRRLDRLPESNRRSLADSANHLSEVFVPGEFVV